MGPNTNVKCFMPKLKVKDLYFCVCVWGGVFCFYECLPFMTMQSLLVNYCKFGDFAIILFSRIALKDIFATHTRNPRLNV